ncbi:NADP-dependent glyceraldehyde-3-phosphate dehydrogenase [Trifolium repens]|nr:NADP-dependent glyceraldehyde-3-phosphate dehydrogenase [Trifolium repens]
MSLLLSTKIPLGVILTISPFNYPVNLAVSKFAPALIAENSIVLKPPTQVCVVLVLVQGVELSIVYGFVEIFGSGLC